MEAGSMLKSEEESLKKIAVILKTNSYMLSVPSQRDFNYFVASLVAKYFDGENVKK